ncbi:MAG: DinB family protein [Thaumarchaeota archaeon]|nr:DinB family protein [Nitrososphaerota archaeon]
MTSKTSPDRKGELASLRDFFAYNSFVRKKYAIVMGKLPGATLTKDRGASHPSLLDIWTHILDVDRSWLHASETGEDLPAPEGLSVAQLRKFEKEVDEYIESFMRRLKPKDLHKSFRLTTGDGSVLTFNLGETLWHMIEEELQHRGELNALLWQDDIEPPIIDWFAWKRAAVSKK